MLRHKWRKLAMLALALALTVGAVYGCRPKETLDPTEEAPSSRPIPTRPSASELNGVPTIPSEPTDPRPVEYQLTGLWFRLDSSYQVGNSGENFANYHSDQINVSVSWELMPEQCTDGADYIQSFLRSQHSQWDSTLAGQANGVAYGICSTNQGRCMVLGVYPCGKMLGKIVAEGAKSLDQDMVRIVTSGRVEPSLVPDLTPLPPEGFQVVEFGGLQLQIRDSYLVTQEPDNVSCTDGSTLIMICYDRLANYPDCTTAEEVAAHNAALYQGVWETVEADGSTIRMYDNDGRARILVYYLQGQTLWEVCASGTFTQDGLTQMCQFLASAQIVADFRP